MATRVKGKAFVKKHHADAHAERHRTNGNKVYWLIRLGREFMYFSEGETESEAWKNAAAKIELIEARRAENVAVKS